MGHAIAQVALNGTIQQGTVMDIRSVVGPASYTQGTGIVVDLSGVFTTLLGVQVLRAYVTSTKAAGTSFWRVHEASTDLFSNRKFRLIAQTGGTPGTSTDANVLKATGAASSITCSALSGSANLVQASGASKVTAVTAVTAPTALAEIAAATDLSTITVEYLAIGIP